MAPTNKIRVAVLFGGRSAEHEVSLRSAANVMQNLDKNLFEVVPIGIDKQGNWFVGNDVADKSLQHNQVSQIQDGNQKQDGNHKWFTPEWVGKYAEQVPVKHPHQLQALESNRIFDVVFPVVHGTFCEDGTLQGLLELADFPYVGCGVLASAIGMDKDVSKRLAMFAGINIAPYLVLKDEQWQTSADHYIKKISSELNYPVFIKPANAGSSIGISKVKTESELATAIDCAFRFDTKVVIEKALSILELELAVLESLETNAEPIVSLVGEVKSRHEFYSYEAKYVDSEGATLHIPAEIPDAIIKQAQEMAKKIFIALECEGMARVDLFYDHQTQQLYFNEINTIPGFTQISMYPKLMAASGISYSDLLTHLVHLAIKRHEKRTQLHRNYAT